MSTTTSTTPDIVSDDTAESLSIPDMAVELARLMAFETMVGDALKAKRDAFNAAINVAQSETGGKTYQARLDDGFVMADFTLKESKAGYVVTDRAAFTSYVMDNHITEVEMDVKITDPEGMLAWLEANPVEWATVTPKVRANFEKVLLTAKRLNHDTIGEGDDAEQVVIDTATGNIVAGVTYAPARSTGQFGTSWKDGGKERAAKAIIAGAADNLLSSFIAETVGELQAAS
jgi:hypothetical protein